MPGIDQIELCDLVLQGLRLSLVVIAKAEAFFFTSFEGIAMIMNG
jgi:hypothetical protein